MLNRNIQDPKVSVFAARFSVVPGRPHRYDVDGKEAAGLTGEQRAELAALAELPEDEIDTTDIPEVLDWSHARRADLYRPIKQQITLRLDADVVAWFKERAPGGRGYQSDINRALREHVDRTSRQETISAA